MTTGKNLLESADAFATLYDRDGYFVACELRQAFLIGAARALEEAAAMCDTGEPMFEMARKFKDLANVCRGASPA